MRRYRAATFQLSRPGFFLADAIVGFRTIGPSRADCYGRISGLFRALCGFVLLLVTALPALAGMDVMTNQELSEAKGGTMAELGLYTDDYYNSGSQYPGAADVTVVRLASDIYIENYGEFGALKMGNYPRSVEELGDMASMDSNYTMVYGPNNRTSPGGITASFTGDGSNNLDQPYRILDSNTNRSDRIHDRYGGGGGGTITLGRGANMAGNTPAAGFGSTLASSNPETQWDINWEAMQIGLDKEHPMRMYGIVLRAEFSGWGTDQQQLRRFVLGSNNLYGYSHARPLSTSGWLNAEMARLSDALQPNVTQCAFQLQRDPIMDQHWSLSSFDMDPDNSGSDGSFRQFWFNTCMDQITTDPSGQQYGDYIDKNHGFFIAVDVTDRRFSGWNIIGGVNEYQDWPNFEQHDDQYFENKYR